MSVPPPSAAAPKAAVSQPTPPTAASQVVEFRFIFDSNSMQMSRGSSIKKPVNHDAENDAKALYKVRGV
jgi:hypothetical protein